MIYTLHTGQGAAALGLILGLSALGVPVMGASGALVWWAGRRSRPRIRGNRPAGAAQTILLVGSEGGSTWGFAATLHAALTKAGQAVHVAPMSSFAPDRYSRAERIIILAATYGDGAAPASAQGFLARLAALDRPPAAPLAVLGFGDSSFPAYCAYAQAVSDAAAAKGWTALMLFDTVDRQSPQSFARWGRALGLVMGRPLELAHHVVHPKAQTLTLLSRRDYGAEVQAPTSILRFALPRLPLWQRLTGAGFAWFQAGDLLAVMPEGSNVPRLYSLASSSRDGFVEIVVRKQAGGLCSGQLMALAEGDTVTAFLRPNPGFHPDRGRAPLILIGAGTGVGPLAGIIRDNAPKRPIHLFFGMRHPDSDFLYGREMPVWKAEGRLTRLVTAVSRGSKASLTDGRPQIVRIVTADGMDETQILRFAAALDQASKHPVAQAIVAAAKLRGLTLPVPRDVAEIPGEGVVGFIEDRQIVVGGLGFVLQRVQEPALSHSDMEAGAVVVTLAVDGQLAGHLVMSDPLREGASDMIARLREQGMARILLATGDRADVATRVTAGLGLNGMRSDLTPDQKVLLVLSERKNGPVMMIGDGVNDAPALAAADVGVAMGARGAAASAEAADVVLLVDRLDRIAPGLEIAHASRRIALESVVVGIGLSVLGMIAAAFGYLSPVQGALFQEAIDVAVILNALRALRISPRLGLSDALPSEHSLKTDLS